MTSNRTSAALAQMLVGFGAHDAEAQTDGQLLGRFLARRDESAFAVLVRRHGPMVLGVCRRILLNEADAEDAFQAAFLILVRKAASLTPRAVLGDWLHGVARRTALHARRRFARRGAKERAAARPEAEQEDIGDDWLSLLDEELGRLPEKYRLPLVLCDLEGRTRREAAEHLGWPEGTVAGRVARGRALLAGKLARRGLTLSAGSVAMLSPQAASAAVPGALAQFTVQAAGLLAKGAASMISAKVAALTEGVVRAMFLSKLKTAAALVLLISAVAALGYGGLLRGQPNGKADGAAGLATKGEDDPQRPVRLDDGPPRREERKEARRKEETTAAQDADVKSGLKFEGEIDASKPGGEGHLFGYRVVVPLTLKAGQNVSASVRVVGWNRSVGLMLTDPTGKILGSSKMMSRTAQIHVEEVNANGKYTIEVYSDLIGPFTLWATDTTNELDQKMLEQKIKRLEDELADLREKLKAKRKKPQ